MQNNLTTDDAPDPQIATNSNVPRHSCAACHQDWPENVMVAVTGRWMCPLCKERALDDQIPADKKRFRMTSYVPNYRKWIVALVILGIALRIGVSVWLGHISKIHVPAKPKPLPANFGNTPAKRKLDA